MKKIYILTAVFALLTLSLNAQTTYEKVTSTDQLVVGNKYIFVSEEANTAMTATASNSRLTGESVTITSNTVTLSSNSNVAVFTLGGSSNSWTLVNGGKYLTGANNSTNLTLATSQGTYSTWRLNNNNGALSGYRAVNSSNTSRAVLYRTSANQFGGYATSNIGSNSDYSYAFLYVEASTAPTIQVSTNSLSMSAAPGSSATETVTVTGRNLTDGINYTLTDANGVFSVNRPSMGSEGGTLTVTYSPTAVGTHTATLTLSSNGAQDVTIPLNGTSSYTIGDGTSSDYYLPAYGSYQDYGYKNQMIYTAAQLAEIGIQNGDKITSITFYPTTASGYNGGIDFYGSTVTLSLGNTNVSSFSGSKITPSDLTDMVTITPVRDNNATEWTFSWSTPFTYTGGNLLVQVYCPGYEKDGTNGDYGRTYFKGDNKNSNVSLYSYNSSASSTSGTSGTTGTNSTFQPQASFTFESSVPVHDLGITLSEPTAVVAGENATITATVTNNGNQTESGYTVTFSDGTNTFSTQTGGTLAPGATETFTATYTTSAAGTVTITANVACTDDSDATNDEATTTLTVNAPVHDLGITLSAPAEVVGGNSATVTATVTNNGNQPMSGYTVTITDGTNTLLTQTVNEALAPGATATFTATYATTEAQVGTTVNFTATVACTGDADQTNDNATASMSIISMPPPENVVATPDSENHSATVTWDAPTIAPVIETVVEDFEDTSVFPTFTTGGVNANSNTGAFGNWTLYDGNGVNVYGMSDVDFGTNVEQTPYAWMPFDLTATNPVWTVTNIYAHSGQQFMNSVSVPSATTNHWLISPELSGNAQTISWYDAEMKTSWGAESYEVLYSTTDNNPSSFISLGTYSADALTWGYETANLPEGAKYFAIRHTQNDGFGLMIDDVTYEALVPGLQPVSYNVYLDGNLVGSVNANDPLTYDFNNVSNGSHTVEISAVYPGNIESALVPASFSIVGKTATPTINYVDNGDGTYTVTATGDGEVTLNVGGQTATGTGSASVIIVRSTETQTVTATATAQAEGMLESDPATQNITIPALTTDPTQMLEGLLRLHLVIVDQMKEEIPDDNSHPDRYGYMLRYEPNGANDTTGMKESSTVYVDIQKADCEVMGAYTLAQVDNDKHIGINHDQGIKMNVISADVEYNLSATNDLLYDYRLQGAENATPSYQSNYLSRLQKTQNFTYVEMEESNPNKGHEYPNGEYHYFVGEDNLKTGNYGSSYVSYAPSVSTWGIQRRYYEEDGYDNTYGAAIAKTGAGYVEMTADPKAELQTGKNGSTNWEYDGQACSLYILDNIKAEGKLPHSSVTTLSYEPYMFRVFVESKNGLLRHFQKVDGDGQTTGEHYEGIAGDPYGPICVWSGYVVDDNVYGQKFGERTEGTEKVYIFEKDKVDRTNANGAWDQDESNAIFAAVDALAIEGYDSNGKPIEKDEIDSDDLNIFVRFYYIIEGSADDHDVQSGNDIVNGSRDGESSRPGNGAESPGKSPDPATGVSEVVYNGEVVSVTYVNSLGMQSDKPFDGVNIVVTRYSDGKTSTTKVVR